MDEVKPDKCLGTTPNLTEDEPEWRRVVVMVAEGRGSYRLLLVIQNLKNIEILCTPGCLIYNFSNANTVQAVGKGLPKSVVRGHRNGYYPFLKLSESSIGLTFYSFPPAAHISTIICHVLPEWLVFFTWITQQGLDALTT